MTKQPIHILRQFKKWLALILTIAIIAELFFFPTLPNFFGCVMAFVSFWVFSFFLKEKYIRLFPFAFCMYLSMFMYRYLPIIATLTEGKPISYGFERPYETFLFEIILFLISSLAFYFTSQSKFKNLGNNLIQKSLHHLKFFEITPSILWGMGILGFIIRIYNFNSSAEYGDIGGKFLLGLNYLMYAPLCLLFPSLLNLKYTKHKTTIAYLLFIFIINIASNSRQGIITPIAIAILLFLLFLLSKNIKITQFLSKPKIFILSITLVSVMILLSNISLAMLHTRNVRAQIGKLELFQKTIETVLDSELMMRLKVEKHNSENSKFISYRQGWTENYVDNFMLSRYANMRITDETIYYAEKKGYSNLIMQHEFIESIINLIPTPLLSLFNVSVDKKNKEFSKGDLLYGKGFGGFRVTSHVGDGLATFGFSYFPLQFFTLLIVFKLLNTYIYFTPNGFKYSPFALMSIFNFLGMFRNAQGIYADFSFILRGYLQGILTYLVVFYIIKFILNILKIEKLRISDN